MLSLHVFLLGNHSGDTGSIAAETAGISENVMTERRINRARRLAGSLYSHTYEPIVNVLMLGMARFAYQSGVTRDLSVFALGNCSPKPDSWCCPGSQGAEPDMATPEKLAVTPACPWGEGLLELSHRVPVPDNHRCCFLVALLSC
jgi:hypothetical protein